MYFYDLKESLKQFRIQWLNTIRPFDISEAIPAIRDTFQISTDPFFFCFEHFNFLNCKEEQFECSYH